LRIITLLLFWINWGKRRDVPSLAATRAYFADGWKADINWGSSLAVKIDDAKIRAKFASAVNMTADELEAWLATEDSRAVGWKGLDGRRLESIGHASGRRIVRILRTPASGLAPDDYLHMRKVVGFMATSRSAARQPGDVEVALFTDELGP
jgi:hypothetical protein